MKLRNRRKGKGFRENFPCSLFPAPLFTFQFLDILIVFVGGLILFAGLTFFALKRRNEILRDFLTPEEPDIEQEFFKLKEKPKPDAEPIEEQPVEPESNDTAIEETGWGTG